MRCDGRLSVQIEDAVLRLQARRARAFPRYAPADVRTLSLPLCLLQAEMPRFLHDAVRTPLPRGLVSNFPPHCLEEA
jgi:hypothetical protein